MITLQEISNIYDNRISRNQPWKVLDFDYYYYYTKFSDRELMLFIHYINKKIEKIEQEKISDRALKASEKQIEDFVSTLPKETYVEILRMSGPQRYIFDFNKLKMNASQRKTKWIKRGIELKFDVKVKVSHDNKKNYFNLEYLTPVDDSTKEEINSLIDERYSKEVYRERIENDKEEVKMVNALIERQKNLYENYLEEKKKYRQECIKKACLIERWKRLIWVIEIEKRLRDHEQQFSVKIKREPLDGDSEIWKRYKLVTDNNGLIKNAFIVINHVPYRLIYIDKGKHRQEEYEIAYLEHPDDSYESMYHIVEPHPFAKTWRKLFEYDMPYKVLITNVTDGNVFETDKDFKDFQYFAPSTEKQHHYHVEEVDPLEELLNEDNDDDFEADDLDILDELVN